MSATIERTSTAPPTGYFRNPWRKPRVLQGVTIGYLLWSLLPVLIAVLYSFNAGRSRTTWQGFSTRWYWGDATLSVWHNDALHTALLQTIKLGVIATLITVQLGTLFAIGIDRWRGRLPAGSNMWSPRPTRAMARAASARVRASSARSRRSSRSRKP